MNDDKGKTIHNIDGNFNQYGDQVGRDKNVYINESPQPVWFKQNRKEKLPFLRKLIIEDGLNQNVQGGVYLELKIKDKKSALEEYTWTVCFSPEEQLIPPDTTILKILNQSKGSLLVLGGPASGKTIFLHQLGKYLIEVAEKDENALIPIPLRLSWNSSPTNYNLFSWILGKKPENKFLTWLKTETNRQIGLRHDFFKKGIEDKQFVFLLDGLDEVLEKERTNCLQAIKEFVEQSSIKLVISCRSQDYEQIEAKLNLCAALEIQPLIDIQINKYLDRFEQVGVRVQELIKSDREFFLLAQSPLMLSLLTEICAEDIEYQIPFNETSLEEKRTSLFSTYIRMAFARRNIQEQPQSYSRENAIKWLTNIAYHMDLQQESYFYIERLQSSWLLDSKRITLLKILSRLSLGVSTALITMILFYVLSQNSISLWWGLIVGFCTALTSYQYHESTRLYEQIRLKSFSFKPIFSSILQSWEQFSLVGLINSLIVSVFLALAVAFENTELTAPHMIFESSKASFTLTALGTMFLIVIWIIIFTIVEVDEASQRKIPNQGISSSLKNGCLFSTIVGLLMVICMSVTFWTLAQDNQQGFTLVISIAPLYGAIFAWLTFAQQGGSTYITHYILRGLLHYYEILPYPFNTKQLVAYLNDMKDRDLLKTFGGGWIFRHRYLLEHFAKKHPDYKKPQQE